MTYKILDPNNDTLKDTVEVKDLHTCNQVFMYKLLGWKVVEMNDQGQNERKGDHGSSSSETTQHTQKLVA